MRNQQSPTTEPVALEAAPRNAQDAEAEAIAPLAVEVDTSETPLRAKRDGCGCPPFVAACVHFGNEILVHVVVPSERCFCNTSPIRHQVGTIDFWHDPTTPDGCDHKWANRCGKAGNFPDLPSAQAAFDIRAEELRTG